MAEPIIIYNEMMVKNDEYQWDLDLRNAKKDRFKKLKRHAEDSLDRFYLQSTKMWDLGYQGLNSIESYFAQMLAIQLVLICVSYDSPALTNISPI